MARQEEIKSLLREIAPLFKSIASDAQRDAGALAETAWAKTHLVRDASLNQVTGTARWRMVGDRIVLRQGELPEGLELSTTDEEHNQGRYYLRAPKLGIVLTIRRKPHKKDDQPELLQLQIEEALECAPIDYGDKVVVYLAVGAIGTGPQFDVVNRGEVVHTYRLADLVEEGQTELSRVRSDAGSVPAPGVPEPTVRSAFEEEVAKEDPTSAEN
ncbi:MAG: hypothetical protein ACRDPE_00830 [Solirubrobacterales bacterium]